MGTALWKRRPTTRTVMHLNVFFDETSKMIYDNHTVGTPPRVVEPLTQKATWGGVVLSPQMASDYPSSKLARQIAGRYNLPRSLADLLTQSMCPYLSLEIITLTTCYFYLTRMRSIFIIYFGL